MVTLLSDKVGRHGTRRARGLLLMVGIVIAALGVLALTRSGGTRSGGGGATRAAAAGHRRQGAYLRSVPRPASLARDSFGVNAQFLFPLFPPSVWALQAGLMRQTGIQIVRVDASWGDVEPTPPDAAGHHYRWAYFDGIAGTLAAAHMRWLPIIDFSAPWDASYNKPGVDPKLSAPRDPAYFASFAAALVARYGPLGAFWRQHPSLPRMPVQATEIWNEENLPIFWNPTPDPAAYLRLYEATRAAIRAVAPNVEVMVGGLANPATDYLTKLYAAGDERVGLFDGVAIHPYDVSVAAVIGDVAQSRALLDGHGDVNVPLDVTEVGWPTQGSSGSLGVPIVSDVTRGQDLAQLTSQLSASDCGVERIFPHTWVSLENKPNDPGDWFGLANPSGSLTQSAIAYGAAIGSMERRPIAQASKQLCRRAPAVAIGRGAAHGRHRVGVHRACATVTVSYEGAPLNGARVMSVFLPGPGWPAAKPSLGSRVTGRRGHATLCVHSTRPTVGTFVVTVTRRDFARDGSAHLPAVLH